MLVKELKAVDIEPINFDEFKNIHYNLQNDLQSLNNNNSNIFHSSNISLYTVVIYILIIIIFFKLCNIL